MRNTVLKKVSAIAAIAALMMAMLPMLNSTALAAVSPDEALSGTITGYYQGSEQGVLDDWEELAAISAANEDLTDYVLPATQTGTASTTVLIALMKGDMDGAENAAADLVSGTALVPAGYAYGDALNMVAIEAYNRSAGSSVSFSPISYDKDGAVTTLLSYQESDGGFGYGYGGDPDTTGLALVALSLYKDDGTGYAADATHAIDTALCYLDSVQQDNGGFLGWSGNNADSAALVIWGLAALGEDPDTAMCSSSGYSPVDALLSFYVDGGGFGVTGNTAIDIYATKDASLALADVVNNHSFLKSLSASAVQYNNITVQVIKEDGSFVEKQVTAAADEPVEDAMARALGIDPGDIVLADYNCYIDGNLDTDPASSDLQDGSTLLAVYKDYSQVAYFETADGDTMGVNQATIPFGGSQELTLVQADLADLAADPAVLAAIPVDINDDGFSDTLTDSEGTATVSPIEAGTITITAIKSAFDNNVAVLPAHITMQSGTAQSATVSVRIEGISSNVLFYPSFTVGNSGSSLLTVYDAVAQALDDAEVDYTADASGYISEINGTAVGSGNGPLGWDGWVYNIIETKYLDGTAYVAGMKNQPVAGGEEIVVYYCNDDYSTLYPLLETKLESDGRVTITISAYQYDNSYNCVLSPLEGVDVVWGDGTAYSFSGTTNSSGTVSIPASCAPLGSHSLQISKSDACGLPSVVRLAPGYAITVTESGTTGPSSGNTSSYQVYLTVSGPTDTMLSRTSYDWFSGITPLDLLSLSGLNYTSSNSGYVSAIEGIEEFDYGPNSGWLYKVNGDETITMPAASYSLSPGDDAEWFYTYDYTEEPGSSQWSSSSTAVTTTAVTTTITVQGVPTGIIPEDELNNLIKEIALGNNAVAISAELTDANGGVNFAIPSRLLAALCESPGSSLTINSASGSITFDYLALQNIYAAAGSSDILFTLAPVDIATLSVANQQLVGNHPVYSLSLNAGGVNITSFGSGSARILLPCVPGPGENPDCLTVYYLNDNGSVSEMAGAAYDSAIQAMVFNTGHLSVFAVGYDASAQVAPGQFIDVADDFWARDMIYYLAGKGIIKGTTAETFSPDNTVTRAEFACMLARMSGEPLPLAAGRFSDVAPDAWFASEVEWAARAGIIKGNEAAGFAPGDYITREDMAVMALRYVEYKEFLLASISPATVFNDQEQIASYALEAVDAMQRAGIMSGRMGNYFAPGENASRAEAAQMLGKLCKLMED